jgi:hypothetical protein
VLEILFELFQFRRERLATIVVSGNGQEEDFGDKIRGAIDLLGVKFVRLLLIGIDFSLIA